MRFAEIVESNGNEVDFMKDVIAYITGIDSGITCEDDPDDEYDVGTVGTSHIPTFRFSFNNNHVMTIKRTYDLSSYSQYMTIDFIKDDQIIGSNYISFIAQAKQWDTDANRKFSMSYIESSGFYILDFVGTFSQSAAPRFNIVFAESGNNSYGSYKIETINSSDYKISVVFNTSEYVYTGIDSEISGTALSRFTYKTQPGKVDYIKSSIYVNSGVKQFEIFQLYDCTEVSPGSAVSLKDGAYLAVGPHQLVKVS